MIMIGPYELMVKDACSGMNSIFALSAIGVFYVHEFVHNNWARKIILILSIIPITILANFFRVLALVLGSYYFGVDNVEGLFHDATGIALFVFALLLFFFLDSAMIAIGFVIRKVLRSSARERDAGLRYSRPSRGRSGAKGGGRPSWSSTSEAGWRAGSRGGRGGRVGAIGHHLSAGRDENCI